MDRGTVVEKGSVRSVFANPRSDAAKRLVNPDREDESFVIPEGSRAMRLSFDDSETTETPLIAKLAIEKGIQANILSASTRSVEGKAFGKMILSIEDKGTDFQDAMVYLNQSGGVRAEEVTE